MFAIWLVCWEPFGAEKEEDGPPGVGWVSGGESGASFIIASMRSCTKGVCCDAEELLDFVGRKQVAGSR